MFVDIVEFKNAIAVENILTPYKKGRLAPDKKTRLPKEPITPDVCMEVLQSTNYARNIKDMLQCIAELPSSEQAQFNDIVLACFFNRQQPREIFDLAQKIVPKDVNLPDCNVDTEIQEGWFYPSSPTCRRYMVTRKTDFQRQKFFDYDDDKQIFCDGIIFLNKYDAILLQGASKFPPLLDASRCERIWAADANFFGVEQFVLGKKKELALQRARNLPENLDCSQCESVTFDECDLSGLKNLRFAPNAALSFEETRGVPRVLDVANCFSVSFGRTNLTSVEQIILTNVKSVNFEYIPQLPKTDFSSCDKVSIYECGCHNLDRLVFCKGANVSLSDVKDLPDVIDVSPCAKVQFSYMDLHGFEQMKFAQGANVSFRVTKLPQNIDVSQCDNVVFEYTDTSHLKDLKFKENSSVSFDIFGGPLTDSEKYRLPDNLDVSPCAKVEFNCYDLSACNNLKFKDGAEVSFMHSIGLPDDLDVANCSKVNFRGCDLKHFSEIHFNNAEFVSFAYVKSYPQVLDVSNCKNVYFAKNVSDDMFKNSKKFIFKNRQQMNSFNFKTPENWSGQIVFADEQHDLNLALVATKVKDGR